MPNEKDEKEENNPSYWAVISSDVLLDKRLSANEKLLYAVITTLQKTNGYCYASNSYFEDVFEKDKRTIQRWLQSLMENGHIHIDYTYKKVSKELDKRLISVTPPQGQKCHGVGAKMSWGI